MTSIRSSGLPHLAGLSGLTNFRLNRMDLPCSRCSLWLHAGGTNPGSTAGHSHCCAACDSAFPFERQGRLLRSRSISGLFCRSLYSGLQPPCLRFAVAVTGHHARLGTRLLARLYRGRHLRRRRSTHLQGATLIKPGVPISGTRLSDQLHREAHSGGAMCTRRSGRTPSVPKIIAGWNLRVPRPCTLCRLRRKCLTRSLT
jgi:hypothetical protein